MARQQQQVDITQLGASELQNLHQELTSQVESFTSNMVALQQTAARFANAGQSVEALKEQQEGQSMLLPMTESLYVPGTLESVGTVLLEIGTGYFIEKDIDGGIDYCRRKVMLVKGKMDQLGQIMQTRRNHLQQIESLLMEKQEQQK